MMLHGKHKLPITILICNNSEDERLVTRQTFEDSRIANELRFVDDGKQLLDYLYQRGVFAGETGAAPRPGLILIDLDTSMDGSPQALRQLGHGSTLFDIPVVGLTASALGEGVARRPWLGVSSFITKPVTFPRLIEAINTLDRYWLQIVERPPIPA